VHLLRILTISVGLSLGLLSIARVDAKTGTPSSTVQSSVVQGAVQAVVRIDDPAIYQKVLAISDVHGMIGPLKNLLQSAQIIDSTGNWAAGKTLLVITGDSIDKGDNSVDVLNLWMQLVPQAEKAGGRVLHLLGNHEAELLAYGKESEKAKELFKEFQRKGIKKRYFVSEESVWGKYLRPRGRCRRRKHSTVQTTRSNEKFADASRRSDPCKREDQGAQD
jgi:hypothetical protein